MLLARIRALRRHNQTDAQPDHEFGPLSIDRQTRGAVGGDRTAVNAVGARLARPVRY